MKNQTTVTSHCACRSWLAFAALSFAFAAMPRPAAAQAWTVTDTYNAWAGFNTNFLYEGHSSTQWWYASDQLSTQKTNYVGIWQDAELIEIAEDAYYYAAAYYTNPDLSSYVTKINNLCGGWLLNHSGWQGDNFYDDLNWASIAFIRAYQICGDSPSHPSWRSQAEAMTDWVWSHAQIKNNAAVNGLRQHLGSDSAQANVNYTFVIAGHLLTSNGAGSSYQTHADTVYNWAVTEGNLYGLSGAQLGQVFDTAGTNPGALDYAMDYGIALHAAALSKDGTVCQNMANWLINSFHNGYHPYDAPQYLYNGVLYNILPDYAGGSGDYPGFDAICFRGFGFAASRGFLTTAQITWMQANVALAFSCQNAANLMHNDWHNPTPDTDLYSWNCCNALSGMLNIPAP